MIDLTNLPRHPMMESMVDDLCPENEPHNRPFYRIMVGYFFSKMAASMRAVVDSPVIGEVPVNCFAVALAPSGFGKNTSVSAIERAGMKGFKNRFITETMPVIAEQNLYALAMQKAVISGRTEDEEKDRMQKMYNNAGPYMFSAKKATASSIEQLRSKLLMAGVGSINLQVDEIGMNITDKFVMEGLTLFLELYDMGHTDAAMTRNTTDNMRVDDIDGFTPACLLAFGTPTKLFDGSDAEKAFMQLLDTGYARRCIFAWGEKLEVEDSLTDEEMYDLLLQKRSNGTVVGMNSSFYDLADEYKSNWSMDLPRDAGLTYIEYKRLCKGRVAEISTHEDIRRTEMEHRHWKALKLAGAMAFVDESIEVTIDHLLAAIAIVEDSGVALKKVLNPEKPYVKLAKFIADATEPLTHADLYENLPFYKAGQASRNELMNLAAAWGYKNNVIIRKMFEDGIDFFEGESLSETNLDDIKFSYSNHEAFHYTTDVGNEPGETVAFRDFDQLVAQPDLHWCNHTFEGGHRANDNVIPGFNMLVVDVDGGVQLDTVHDMMDEFEFMTYTTKRHTDEKNRFRLMLPTSHVLHMGQEEYREFMENFFMWLPFESDHAANQRSKKWLTCENALVHHHEGTLLNVLPFIPKTSKNADYRQSIKELGSLDNLERWFAQRMVSGDRNNQMAKFAFALLDTGMPLIEIQNRVVAFNNSMSNGLTEHEIRDTVMKSVAKKYANRA